MGSSDFGGEGWRGDDDDVDLAELEVEDRAVGFGEGSKATVRVLALEIMHVADYGKLRWTRRKVISSFDFSLGF